MISTTNRLCKGVVQKVLLLVSIMVILGCNASQGERSSIQEGKNIPKLKSVVFRPHQPKGRSKGGPFLTKEDHEFAKKLLNQTLIKRRDIAKLYLQHEYVPHEYALRQLINQRTVHAKQRLKYGYFALIYESLKLLNSTQKDNAPAAISLLTKKVTDLSKDSDAVKLTQQDIDQFRELLESSTQLNLRLEAKQKLIKQLRRLSGTLHGTSKTSPHDILHKLDPQLDNSIYSRIKSTVKEKYLWLKNYTVKDLPERVISIVIAGIIIALIV